MDGFVRVGKKPVGVEGCERKSSPGKVTVEQGKKYLDL